MIPHKDVQPPAKKKPPKDISTLFRAVLEDLRLWVLGNLNDERKMAPVAKCLENTKHAMKSGTEAEVLRDFLPWSLELTICDELMKHLSGQDREKHVLATWVPREIADKVRDIVVQYDWRDISPYDFGSIRNLDWEPDG